MDEKLIREIIDYIETMEEKIDGEWGSCRTFDELLADNEKNDGLIPDIYFKLKAMLE